MEDERTTLLWSVSDVPATKTHIVTYFSHMLDEKTKFREVE